mmetsp:Transcript_35827/g.65041  ORF Transcript_35827/g.65041 Transcript_35827/m.65041 type:complete len:263 (-) Transcript_35827:1085-1873(-)
MANGDSVVSGKRYRFECLAASNAFFATGISETLGTSDPRRSPQLKLSLSTSSVRLEDGSREEVSLRDETGSVCWEPSCTESSSSPLLDDVLFSCAAVLDRRVSDWLLLGFSLRYQSGFSSGSSLSLSFRLICPVFARNSLSDTSLSSFRSKASKIRSTLCLCSASSCFLASKSGSYEVLVSWPSPSVATVSSVASNDGRACSPCSSSSGADASTARSPAMPESRRRDKTPERSGDELSAPASSSCCATAKPTRGPARSKIVT